MTAAELARLAELAAAFAADHSSVAEATSAHDRGLHSNQTSLSSLQDLAGGFAAEDSEVQPASLSGRSRTNLAGERLVLTVAEAGALLGVSRAFAYELVARGELPVIRLGRRILVPEAALFAMVGLTAETN
jgi:excisionase family DNA binding protein